MTPKLTHFKGAKITTLAENTTSSAQACLLPVIKKDSMASIQQNAIASVSLSSQL